MLIRAAQETGVTGLTYPSGSCQKTFRQMEHLEYQIVIPSHLPYVGYALRNKK